MNKRIKKKLAKRFGKTRYNQKLTLRDVSNNMKALFGDAFGNYIQESFKQTREHMKLFTDLSEDKKIKIKPVEDTSTIFMFDGDSK